MIGTIRLACGVRTALINVQASCAVAQIQIPRKHNDWLRPSDHLRPQASDLHGLNAGFSVIFPKFQTLSCATGTQGMLLTPLCHRLKHFVAPSSRTLQNSAVLRGLEEFFEAPLKGGESRPSGKMLRCLPKFVGRISHCPLIVFKPVSCMKGAFLRRTSLERCRAAKEVLGGSS